MIEVSDEQFSALVAEALETLPRDHRKAIKNVALVYEQEPSLEQRERLIVKFAVLAGLRPGEIFGLKWGHIMETHVHIRQRVYRGEIDSPKTMKSIRKAALPAGLDADIKEYPEARHAFLNRFAVASPLVPVMKVAGVGYNHTAAADAKKRILTFFDRHLRQGV